MSSNDNRFIGDVLTLGAMLFENGIITSYSFLDDNNSFVYEIKSEYGKKFIQIPKLRNSKDEMRYFLLSVYERFFNRGIDMSYYINTFNVVSAIEQKYDFNSGNMRFDDKIFAFTHFSICKDFIKHQIPDSQVKIKIRTESPCIFGIGLYGGWIDLFGFYIEDVYMLGSSFVFHENLMPNKSLKKKIDEIVENIK